MPRRNLLAIVMSAAVSFLCWQASRGGDGDDTKELYGLFVDAVEQVESNYVRPVSRRELLESALRGMLQDLDPHSSFINRQEWKRFRRQIEGSFGGIGIQVEIDDETHHLSVIAPMVGTPAYAAGILAGDVILEVDGQSTENINLDKAVEVLQGRPGTEVKLLVRHEGAEKPETITITRAIIDMPSVLGDVRKSDGGWDYMIDKDRKIGYVRITSFIQNTAEELKKVLSELRDQGMKALILDLRSNPGGLLGSAVEISDLFVDDGVIVSTKGRSTPTKVYEAHHDAPYTDFPMAVLVNRGSASAAEIVSACLQDHKRAVVIGERSYGKGSVQNILELEEGNSVLKLTVATYRRPSGKNIHRFKNAKDSDEWGVVPNPGMEVKFSTKEFYDWTMDRRDRDLPARSRKPKGNGSPRHDTPDDAKPKATKGEEKKDGEAAKKDGEAAKPFVDRQLQKALEVLREKLAAPAAEPKDKEKEKKAAALR